MSFMTTVLILSKWLKAHGTQGRRTHLDILDSSKDGYSGFWILDSGFFGYFLDIFYFYFIYIYI